MDGFKKHRLTTSNLRFPCHRTFQRWNDMFFEACLIPKIKETHHTAKQFAVPGLLQFEIDIASAAAEHVNVVEKVVRPPFMYLRFDIALANSHFRIDFFTQIRQIIPHVLLALDMARVHDVGAIFSCYCVGEVHTQFVFGPLALIKCFRGFGCSTVLNTWRCDSISKKANTAPNTSEMVIEAQTPVRPLPPALTKIGGMR